MVDRFLVVYPEQRLKQLKIYHRARRKPEAHAKSVHQNFSTPNNQYHAKTTNNIKGLFQGQMPRR